MSAVYGAVAALCICLSGFVVSRVVSRECLVRGRARLGPVSAGWWRVALLPGRERGRRSFQKSGALRQNGLEGVDIILNALAAVQPGKLDSRKCAAVRAEVPPRNQVARGRLVVDLSRGWQGQVQLGREVEV